MIDRELHALKTLEPKFALSSEFSEFFDKIPNRMLFDVLFRVFRFSKSSLCPDIFIHNILKLCRHLGTNTCWTCLPWQVFVKFYHFVLYILTLKFRAKINKELFVTHDINPIIKGLVLSPTPFEIRHWGRFKCHNGFVFPQFTCLTSSSF